MNTHNYDRIIELYLDGALSPVEEHEFRALVEAEPELRQLLDAELAVRRTFDEDAEAIPVETERSYARFLAALATTAPAADADASGGSAFKTGAMPAGGWLTSSFMKTASAAVVAVGLAVGGYYALNTSSEHTGSTNARGASPTVGAPSVDERQNGGDMNARSSDATTVDASVDAASRASEGSTMSSQRVETKASSTTVREATEPRETRAIVDPHDDLTEIEKAIENEEDLPVIENDSVSARINLKLGR